MYFSSDIAPALLGCEADVGEGLQQRRKETSPIRIFGPGAITPLALGDEEVLPLLQSVPPDTYWSQWRRQEECEEPHRWLTRLHRDPTRAVSQVDDQFYQVANARIGAFSDDPDL